MAGALYGYALVSELALARLRRGPAPRGRITVRAASGPRARPDANPVVAVEDGFSVHRHDHGLTMWCSLAGTFHLDPVAGAVTADPTRAPGPDWEHRLACVAVPLMLAERGDLALHASAVAVDGRAVAFAAPSGRGKSTIAAALGESGLRVLAEDACVVDAEAGALRVWPALRGVRLPGDVLAGDDTSAAPVPLAAVVLLGPRRGSRPALEPVAAADAITALMPNTMHALGPSQAAAFRGAAAVARTVPVVRATLPDDLTGAADHARSLLREVLDVAGP